MFTNKKLDAYTLCKTRRDFIFQAYTQTPSSQHIQASGPIRNRLAIWRKQRRLHICETFFNARRLRLYSQRSSISQAFEPRTVAWKNYYKELRGR